MPVNDRIRRWVPVVGGWALVSLLVALLVAPARLRAVEPVHRDVEYARVGSRSLTLDLYLPSLDAKGGGQGQTGHVTVIWIHGGAWRRGSKDQVPVLKWLDRPVAIASVDYRLSPEAKFPAQMHDIKAAIRFLRARASAYGLDAERFVIAGSSAGGHLAALAGVSHGVNALEGALGKHTDTSSQVQAIVSFFGASNLQTILGQSTPHGLSVRVPALQLLLGGQPDELPEVARLASPVTHVDRRDPPLWLIHGNADPQMPFEQSRELQARYQALRLPVALDVVEGGQHGGPEFFSGARLTRIADEVARALAASPAVGRGQ